MDLSRKDMPFMTEIELKTCENSKSKISYLDGWRDLTRAEGTLIR